MKAKAQSQPKKKRKKRGFGALSTSPDTVHYDHENLTYFRIINGRSFKCFNSGYLRDFEDEKVSISHGRYMEKPSLEACRKMNMAIDKKMAECFPDSLERCGEIRYVEISGTSKRRKEKRV